MLLFLGWLLLGGVGLACWFLYRLVTASGSEGSLLEPPGQAGGGPGAGPLAIARWASTAEASDGVAWGTDGRWEDAGQAWEPDEDAEEARQASEDDDAEDGAPAWEEDADDGAAWEDADGWGSDGGGYDGGGYDG